MRKIAIPAILAGVVLVAGFVAFAPVEKASAVHTTILGNTSVVRTVAGSDTDIDDGDVLSLTCNAPFVVHAVYSDISGTVAANDPSVLIQVSGLFSADHTIVTSDNIGGGDDELLSQDGPGANNVASVVALDAGDSLKFTFDETSDEDDEALTLTAIVTTTSQATCSLS